MEVYFPNEIELYGTRFPLWGQVRRDVVTPFPPKSVIGDYSRDSNIVKSSWVLSKFSGGLGKLYGQVPQDDERYWFSSLDTRWRYLTLAPEFFKTSDFGPVQLFIEYNETLLAVVDNDVYRWDDDAVDWIDLEQHLEGAVQSSALYDGNVYIQTQSHLYEYDGTTWDDEELGGYAIIMWDDKLFRLDNTNQMHWSIDPLDTGSWTLAGQLPLPAGYCNQLIIYFDQTGESCIHAITRVGLWGYEFDSHKFYITPLTFPNTPRVGKAVMHRGTLYVPAGAAVYSYDGQTIQVVGPAKDDGLPPEVRGDVIQMVSSHGYLFAVLSAEGTEDDLELSDISFKSGNPFETEPTSTTAKIGTVLVTPEASWHSMWSAPAGFAMGAAVAAVTNDEYRLWISDSNGIYYTPLGTELHNPLQSPTETYTQEGYLETFWTDTGWAEIPKLAVGLDVMADQISNGNQIRILVGWDEQEGWEELGIVRHSGRTYFPIGFDHGREFKQIRFRFEFTRDPNNATTTPILKSAVLGFLRRPEQVWGFNVEIQVTDYYEGLTPIDMMERLIEIVRTEEAGWFVYGPEEDKRARVVVSRMSTSDISGLETGGKVSLGLLEITEPSIVVADEA